MTERDAGASSFALPPGASGPGIESELDRRVGRMVPSILTGLVLVSGGLAFAQAVLPGQPQEASLLTSKAGAALLFLLGRLALRARAIPEGRAHLVAVAVGAVALGVLLHQLNVTGEPRETAFLLILLVGAGFVCLDPGWFALFTGLVLGGWALVAGPGLGEPEWTYYGLALLVAAGMATAILLVRLRGLLRLDAFQRQERVRQLELETALEQTERARQGEEEARKALESALVQVKESEERFRRLADASFEGVLVFREGRIVDANSRAAELFSVTVAQLIGDPVTNLVAPPDRAEAEPFLLSGGTRGFVESLQVEGRRYDGTRFPMELSVVDSALQGRPARVLVVRDITHQKRVEGVLRRALAEAEANSRAKSTFLANMSHELRTPLNSVIGFANILRKRQHGRVPDQQVDFLRRIVANGEHLLALIEDILDLSRIDARRMELQLDEVDLVAVVDDVIGTLEVQVRKKGLELRVEHFAAEARVKADRRRLTQVLLNLVGNAVKFTPEGEVWVRLIGGDDGRPSRIEIEDTGIGIPEGQLEAVFDPFHQVDASRTRAFGGSGLGLAISRSLCRLMDFELGVSSEEGKGSRFTVDLLPAVRDEVDRPEEQPLTGTERTASPS
jgi:PAS domain S-box-containing protein